MTAIYRRMKAWQEQDFTHELTGANDLANMARNVVYIAKENQKTLTSIFKGLEEWKLLTTLLILLEQLTEQLRILTD